MEENFRKNQKTDLRDLPKKKNFYEEDTHITDRSLREYEELLGINFSEMKDQLVLDIGSGYNERFSKDVAEIGMKVVSLAPHLKNVLSDGQFLEKWQKRSVAGRGQEMPFKENIFGCEVAIFSIPLYLIGVSKKDDIEKYKMFFSEVVRTLKPGGKAYFVPIIGEKGHALVSEVLNNFSDSIFYSLEPLPESFMLPTSYRLILTKKVN